MPSFSSQRFPLPFNSARQVSGGSEGPYVVGAMFTASYAKRAERLAVSCETYGLQYAIHEVPVVHRSISPVGADDLGYTKANFIHHLLDGHRKPVLYLDVDCEFVAEPELLLELVKSCCDFAAYNWLADDHTDTFVPMELGIGDDGPPIKNRFFRFLSSIDWHARANCWLRGASSSMRTRMAPAIFCPSGIKPSPRFPGRPTINACRSRSIIWGSERVR